MVFASDNQQSNSVEEVLESELAYANSTIPFLNVVVGEIVQLAAERDSIRFRLAEIGTQRQSKGLDDLYSQELTAIETLADEFAARIVECYKELNQLSRVAFDDRRTGFIDFPAQTDLGQIVFCWKLGEREVCHWHWADETCESRRRLAELTELAGVESSSLPA